jgi:D-tyrosyl-tRNA(Tyr) deacylase
VAVDGEAVAEIGAGLCILLGVAEEDGEGEAVRLAAKVAHLRIFENDLGKFDLSVLDTGGGALVVSQFTLIADTAKGNRPSFSHAAPPDRAEALYDVFCDALETEGVRVGRGVFGARMEVELLNDGPVTIIL